MTNVAEPRPVLADDLADNVLTALSQRRQIAPLSDDTPGLDLAAAYKVAAAVKRLREARGEVVGRAQNRVHESHDLA